MEDAAAQEGIGQLLLRIGGDNHDGALLCLNGFLCFGDIKFHFIQFPQKVVGKFQIGFIDFVNQQNDLLVAVERFAKLAKLDIFADIIHALIAELGIIQTLHNVIHIETILRLCGGFDIPDDKLFAKSLRNCFGKHGFAGTGLALDEQGLLQGDGNIYRTHQLFAGYIIFTSFKCEIHFWFTPFLNLVCIRNI